MKSAILCVATMIALLFPPAAPAHAQDPMVYGKHLAQECTVCHKADGQDKGIPSITGWDTDEFVQTMEFYRQGLRNNQAMSSVAQSLDEKQMKALALYFGSLPKPAREAKK